jgi:DNA-binding transcriptional LysR family regulator
MSPAMPSLAPLSDGTTVGTHAFRSRMPGFVRDQLQPRHLLLLDAVGDLGTLQNAAKQLDLSQPATLRLLNQLEEIADAELFERTAEGLRANWFGKTVIRQARAALCNLGDATNRHGPLTAESTDQVNLGAISGPALSFIPRAVAQLTREYPLLRLRLQVESSAHLMTDLLAGNLDVMVGRLVEGHEASKFNYQSLANEQLSVVARRGHPLLKRKPLRLQDLAAAAWIVPQAGNVLRHQFELTFEEAGYATPRQMIEYVSQMVVTRLLEETNHLAILSQDAAEYYANLGALVIVPFALSCNLEPFGILTRRDVVQSPAVRTLCQALTTAAANNDRRDVQENRERRFR